jgi:hypothetical protein
MSLFPSSRENAELERRLRAGADSFGPRPPRALRGRILAELHGTPAGFATFEPMPAPGVERWGSWIAAAAAVLVLCSAWWLAERARARPGSDRAVVLLSRNLFDAGTLVLALPGEIEDNLRLEATHLLADTTRAAEGVVRGLPAPLRSRLEKL